MRLGWRTIHDMTARDQIYALPLQHVGAFEFDEHVVRVFPDMIARSVPGYGSILAMIGELAATYAVPHSRIYDLGCSLGAASAIMQAKVPASCEIQAVDSSPAMIAALKQQLAEGSAGCGVRAIEGDIRSTPIVDASFSVLNFTLQFVPLESRLDLLQRIADNTLDGGALVLSEKICFDDQAQQQLMTDLHHRFKRANGYSDLEIAQKRASLENTLVPETLATHIERLQCAGFATTSCWFQCFNFVSILAVK